MHDGEDSVSAAEVQGAMPASQPPGQGSYPQGTILAFDFGEKRIGVAVGDNLLRLAHPLTTISEESNEKRFAMIASLCAEWHPVLLVVGLPFFSDGAEHELTRLCRRFARRLEGRFSLKVALVDERYSSTNAASCLDEIAVYGSRRDAVLDQLAAQTILQSFLDGQTHATS